MGGEEVSLGGVNCKSVSFCVFLMFNGRVSGKALKGAGDGDRWILRGPAGCAAIKDRECDEEMVVVVVDDGKEGCKDGVLDVDEAG